MPAKLAAECEGDEGDMEEIDSDVAMETLYIDNDGDISLKPETSNESGGSLVKQKKKKGGKIREQLTESVTNSPSEKKLKKKKKKKKKPKSEALEL